MFLIYRTIPSFREKKIRAHVVSILILKIMVYLDLISKLQGYKLSLLVLSKTTCFTYEKSSFLQYGFSYLTKSGHIFDLNSPSECSKRTAHKCIYFVLLFTDKVFHSRSGDIFEFNCPSACDFLCKFVCMYKYE